MCSAPKGVFPGWIPFVGSVLAVSDCLTKEKTVKTVRT